MLIFSLLLAAACFADELREPPQTAPLLAQMRALKPAPPPAPSKFMKLDEAAAWRPRPQLDKAYASVGRIRLRASPNCTATRISAAGHVLASFQCVDGCLVGLSEVAEDKETHLAFRLDESKLPLVCPSDSGAIARGSDVHGNVWDRPFRLLAVGSAGYLTGYTSHNLPFKNGRQRDISVMQFTEGNQLYRDLRGRGFAGSRDVDDFVLLQEIGAPGGPFLAPSCDDEIPVSATLWSLAYSGYDDGKGRNYLYYPVYTQGRPVARAEDSYLSEFVRQGRMSRDEAAKTFFDPRFLVSTLHIGSGSTGAAVLDDNGRIVASTAFMLAQRTDYVPGSHVSVRMSHIRAVMRRKLPPAVYRAAFGCP